MRYVKGIRTTFVVDLMEGNQYTKGDSRQNIIDAALCELDEHYIEPQKIENIKWEFPNKE